MNVLNTIIIIISISISTIIIIKFHHKGHQLLRLIY